MKELEIYASGQELRTDSRLLASLLDHRHRTILENLDKYHADFCSIAELPFKTESGEVRVQGGTSSVRYALMTEDQCYFLLTLMRNSAKVVKSKLALVKAFRDARSQIAQRDIARIEGKKVRIGETDSIKQLVLYASGQGSKSAAMYYANITKMTNKLLGIESGQRESLSMHELKQVAALEMVVDIAIRDGIKAGLHYKDIYLLAKDRASGVLQSIGIKGVME